MPDLFDLVMNSVCSIWKKAPDGVVDGYGIQHQTFILIKTGVPCRADPGAGKELDTDVAFGIQTVTFFMRPQTVDDPPIPLDIHHWLQINSTSLMDDTIQTFPIDANGTMYDILNIKNPGLIGHHLEIEAKLIEP
jgi:hypothetical protein